MEAAAAYLDLAPNDAVWNERFMTIVEDTAKVNAMAEFGGDLVAFNGGIYAGVRANKYLK